MEDRQQSVILRIGSDYYSLTPAEKRLADYILANQERVVRQSISELAQQSGVAEVLDYAVKVDYWDVDALADAIYGLIKYPALSGMFASKGLEEVTNLKWNDAAAKIKTVYEAVIEENEKQSK